VSGSVVVAQGAVKVYMLVSSVVCEEEVAVSIPESDPNHTLATKLSIMPVR
jgi:hypothetical protein